MQIFRKFLIFFLLLFIVFNLYALKRYDLPYPFPLGPKLDNAIRQNHIKNITEKQPQIVLIGDSTLTKGVNPKLLAKELNQSVYSIDLPGSASTLWYLIIKNNIMQVPVPPKYLLIFFRDTELTLPGYRVQGQYFKQIDEYASPKDDLLIQRAFIDVLNPLERFMEAYVPIYSVRRQMRDELDAHTRYDLPRLTGCASDCVNHALDPIYNNGNANTQALNEEITAADEDLYSSSSLDFNRQVDQSFLPELIRMTQEKNIQLMLVRIKTLQFTQSFPALDKYMNDLKSYAKSNNVLVLDFAGDSRLPLHLYMDILHLNEQGKTLFTGILAETLKPIIR